MTNPTTRAFARTAAAAFLVAAFAAAPALAAASTPAATGWVRLAHFSPNTPPVDVYLYPFGGKSAVIVLKHVAYGTASSYESVTPGMYTVAMRAAGASPSVAPVISTTVDVTAGDAYTVAGLGPYSALRLDVLDDQMGSSVPGMSDVRVIEASLAVPAVTVSDASGTFALNLRFPQVTGYQQESPGPWSMQVAGQGASVTNSLDLAADSSYTLVVLNGTGGQPRVLDLPDSSGSAKTPVGGVETGFGGTAPHAAAPAGSALPEDVLWGALAAAGAGAVIVAGRRMRKA